MLFHVNMTVQIPHDVDPEKIKHLNSEEHERARELVGQGKWLHAWRVAGKWANVSIFEVESPAELHEILNSLPLYAFMEIEVAAIFPMPGLGQEAK
jgi:muconolactone D-isomerase